jgi:hypothetical protein
MQAAQAIGKAKEDEAAAKPQNVRAKPQGQQGTAIGQPIGAKAAEGNEDRASAKKSDAAKTSKGGAGPTNTKTIGQAVDSGYGLPKERDAAKNITAQVNQLVASKTPDRIAAQRLLNTIGEHKRRLRDLQVQQRQGQAQSKDQSKLNFQIQDLMSEYNQSEARLKKVLTKQDALKSR